MVSSLPSSTTPATPSCSPEPVDAVSAVAGLDDVHVAVLSGRSLDGLAQFGFGPDVHVIGSHGMEARDRPMPQLDRRRASSPRHARRPDRGGGRACRCRRVDRAQAGERGAARPTGRPHTRTRSVGSAACSMPTASSGATSKAGSNVLELFTRHADKGAALVEFAVAARRPNHGVRRRRHHRRGCLRPPRPRRHRHQGRRRRHHRSAPPPRPPRRAHLAPRPAVSPPAPTTHPFALHSGWGIPTELQRKPGLGLRTARTDRPEGYGGWRSRGRSDP